MIGGQEEREEPIGDIFARLMQDGRDAARAELGVVRAIAAWRLSGLKIGVPLLLAALFLAQAAITALLVGLVIALAPVIGALLATLLVIVAALGLIGLLAWMGIKRCRTLVAPLPDHPVAEPLP